MANPKIFSTQQDYVDKDPFKGFQIQDTTILKQLEGRHPCPQCGKSRKFFCYTCYVPIAELVGELPLVKLPIKVDIIKHKQEIDGKSTAGHAAVLASLDVSIYTYPYIPDYSKENAVLVFPSQNAITINQLVNKQKYENVVTEFSRILKKELSPNTLMKTATNSSDFIFLNSIDHIPITKAIFIDSTWNQSKSIYKDERVKRIPCVVIQNRISQFWRHQKGSPRWYLATIEAIHQFLVELHLHYWGLHPKYEGISNCFTENVLKQCENLYKTDLKSYSGQYDNLLFFFKHMYDLIHEYYSHDDLHAYKRRLR